MALREFIKKYEDAGIVSGRKEAGRILEELRGCFQERRAAIYEAGILSNPW